MSMLDKPLDEIISENRRSKPGYKRPFQKSIHKRVFYDRQPRKYIPPFRHEGVEEDKKVSYYLGARFEGV